MMQMHYFLRNLRLPIGKVGHLYLPRIREGFFSAARLPLNTILGNSEGIQKSRGLTSPALHSVRTTVIMGRTYPTGSAGSSFGPYTDRCLVRADRRTPCSP